MLFFSLVLAIYKFIKRARVLPVRILGQHIQIARFGMDALGVDRYDAALGVGELEACASGVSRGDGVLIDGRGTTHRTAPHSGRRRASRANRA